MVKVAVKVACLGAPPGYFLANFLPGLLVTDMVKVAVKVVTFNHRHGKS